MIFAGVTAVDVCFTLVSRMTETRFLDDAVSMDRMVQLQHNVERGRKWDKSRVSKVDGQEE